MSYGTLFGVLGGAGVAFFGWTWFSKIPGGAAVRTGYAAMGAGVACVSALAIFLSAHFTRDQIPRLMQRFPAGATTNSTQRYSLAELWREIKGCLANRNYRMLLLGFVALSITLGTRETLTSYSGLFFWELHEKQMRLFGLAAPPAYIVAFFLTVWLHRRIDKRNTALAALVLLVVACASPVLLRVAGLAPANGSPALLKLLLTATFFFYLAVAALMISVLSALADVADEHELETGRRQEGVFFAARTFFHKLSSGLGHVVAGVALDIIHFPTGAKPGTVAQEVAVKLGILDGPLASLPALVSIAFYAAYRIDRQRHSEIQQLLRARRTASGPVVDSAPSVAPTLIQAEHARP
jgi:Na+/melibiose symporter-like transporter